MITPEPLSGTLPGYLPVQEAEKYAGLPIGNRPLSKFEEGDMLAAGLGRDKIADMTPEALKELADFVAFEL